MGSLGGCSFWGIWVENMGMGNGYAHLLMWYSFFVSVLIVLKFVGEYGQIFDEKHFKNAYPQKIVSIKNSL